MTTMTTASSDGFFTIKSAASLCGLSPSVLRVWEFRYGWPTPQRRPNGYRSFTRAQLEELKRVANLLHNGMSIGAIIIDGFPRWPSQLTEQTKRFPTLGVAKGLPGADGAGATHKDRLLTSIERGLAGEALAVAQASCIELRPRDEASAVILPLCVALAELERDGRRLTNDGALRAYAIQRAGQLRSRLTRPGEVQLNGGSDALLAAAAGCALALGGHRGTWATADSANSGDARRISWFGDQQTVSVASLLQMCELRAA